MGESHLLWVCWAKTVTEITQLEPVMMVQILLLITMAIKERMLD